MQRNQRYTVPYMSTIFGYGWLLEEAFTSSEYAVETHHSLDLPVNIDSTQTLTPYTMVESSIFLRQMPFIAGARSCHSHAIHIYSATYTPGAGTWPGHVCEPITCRKYSWRKKLFFYGHDLMFCTQWKCISPQKKASFHLGPVHSRIPSFQNHIITISYIICTTECYENVHFQLLSDSNIMYYLHWFL